MKAATKDYHARWADCKFQSTPPVKAATVLAHHMPSVLGISIHAAREGGDMFPTADSGEYLISIHAAREGGDRTVRKLESCRDISIHAAREGGDQQPSAATQKQRKFQSTPPVKAATRFVTASRHGVLLFQSTPPVKAATQAPHNTPRRFSISIHAAREGGDLPHRRHTRGNRDFNPRRP